MVKAKQPPNSEFPLSKHGEDWQQEIRGAINLICGLLTDLRPDEQHDNHGDAMTSSLLIIRGLKTAWLLISYLNKYSRSETDGQAKQPAKIRVSPVKTRRYTDFRHSIQFFLLPGEWKTQMVVGFRGSAALLEASGSGKPLLHQIGLRTHPPGSPYPR